MDGYKQYIVYYSYVNLKKKGEKMKVTIPSFDPKTNETEMIELELNPHEKDEEESQ